MINSIIKFILSDFSLWTPIVAILIGIYANYKNHNGLSFNILRYLLFFVAGLQGLYTAIMHIFFGDFTSAQIGWQPSPFEFEVGLANLSYAFIGFIAFFKKDFGLWLGVVGGLSVFLIGAGFGHIYQLVAHANHAGSNSGVILYTDIIVPIIMIILLYLRHKKLAIEI